MSLINIFCKTKMYRKNIALLEISSTHITLFSLRGMKISPDQGELNFCSNLEKVQKRLKYQGFMKHLFSKSFLLKNLKDSKLILFSYRNCLTEEQYHGYAPVSLESIGEGTLKPSFLQGNCCSQPYSYRPLSSDNCIWT